ncbi:hypothetical protein JB92DRAFT_2176867 [Gautieria morchelliformis]|nr:hypothetical protein JB92DRAFT_2176867 [Gautieria morchelliformis]
MGPSGSRWDSSPQMVLHLCLYLCLGPVCLTRTHGRGGIHVGGWAVRFCGPAWFLVRGFVEPLDKLIQPLSLFDSMERVSCAAPAALHLSFLVGPSRMGLVECFLRGVSRGSLEACRFVLCRRMSFHRSLYFFPPTI